MFRRRLNPHLHETRGLRDSAILPSIKCSTCGQSVHLRLMPMHQCSGKPKQQQQQQSAPDYKVRGIDPKCPTNGPTALSPEFVVSGKKFHNILEPATDILGEDSLDELDEDEDDDRKSFYSNGKAQNGGSGTSHYYYGSRGDSQPITERSPSPGSPGVPNSLYPLSCSQKNTGNTASSIATSHGQEYPDPGRLGNHPVNSSGQTSRGPYNRQVLQHQQPPLSKSRSRPNLTINTDTHHSTMHPTQDNNHLQRGLSLASQQLRDLASNPPSIGESNLPSTPQAQHHPEISQSLPNRSDLGLSSTTSPSSIAHPRKASAGSLGHHNYHSQRSPGWSIYGLGHIPIQRDPSGLPDMADDAHIPARPPPSHSVNPGVAASRIATNDSVSNASACSGLQASGRSAASSFSTTTSSSSSSVPPAVSSSLAVTASMLQHMRIPENHRHQFGNAAPYIKPNEPFLRSNSDRLAAPSSPQKLPQLPARSTSSTSAAHPHGADNYYSSQTDLIKPAEHSQKLIPAYRSHSNHSVGSVGSGKKRAAQLDTLLGDLMLELEALSTRATTKATTAATVAADSDIESMYSYQSSNNRNITVSPVPMARSASPLKGHGGQIRHLLQQQQQHSHVQTCAKGHEPTGYAAEAITVADAIDSYGNDDSDVNNKHESPGRHVCGACHKVIASTDPDKDLKVFGQYWHAHHLACFTCGVNLSDTTERYERDGRIYCQADYQNLSVANCIACNRPHSPHDSLIALNARWHISCFNCQVCHQKFPDRSFYMLENKPYCRYHYHELNNSLCKKCSEPIEGACAQVVEGRFHPGCFVCETCQQPLRDIYYNFNNKFYCEKHVVPQRATDNSRRRTIFCDL